MCSVPLFLSRRVAWCGLGLCLVVSGCTGPALDLSGDSDTSSTESVSQLQASSYQNGFASGQRLQAATDRASDNTATDQVRQAQQAATANAYEEGVEQGRADQETQ